MKLHCKQLVRLFISLFIKHMVSAVHSVPTVTENYGCIGEVIEMNAINTKLLYVHKSSCSFLSLKQLYGTVWKHNGNVKRTSFETIVCLSLLILSGSHSSGFKTLMFQVLNF